ncbi:MAG: prealbumin-like fold domain-containing protein, partial [Eubacteriales bacterium]|nr:prealbumin-like fold domain-containing protein [Eubacteriales bacterium]
ESTLYQNVKTSPSSVYKWGLDHGGRNGKDIMALVIGPKQSNDPSKPNKNGRDQLMQMVDWLNIDVSTIISGAEPTQYTVYSKKFAASGAFEDNAGNNAFSLTPSSIYTEKWQIWIMASSRATSGANPWTSYGSNAEDQAGSGSGSGNTEVDLNKYYFYTVPAGQTDTLFGFVSVGYVDSITTPDKAKTFGNFLDNINFEIYHPLSGSSTAHGSAIVGGSDGSVGGSGASSGHEVTVDNNLKTYVTDGETLKIQAVIKAADLVDGCQFVGVYHTRLDESGNPVFEFIQVSGNVIEDTGSLTDEEKAGKWVKSTNTNGDVLYTYYIENLTSATDLHFIFIKSPTVTYDPNGGKPYIIENRPHEDEYENVYSFKPYGDSINEKTFIAPYISKAAEGQNDGWKFVGWKLTGDIVDKIPADTVLVNADKLGSLLLPAEHTIACDYNLDDATEESAAQYFKIYGGSVALTEALVNDENGETLGAIWNDSGETKLYANVHRGLTMVAQWRWRQAFIPQLVDQGEYINSTDGGTVEITSVTNTSDENYNDAYNADGGKSYHAAIDERITVKAIAKSGCKFIGWYDQNGKLITTNDEYSYAETTESVKTYYARFSNSVTQTYIRQVKNGDTWEDVYDDAIGTLDRYSYTDAVGVPISSTADAGSGYRFVGWYDSDGNEVPDDMIANSGATISYITTGDATYYARFETAYTLSVSKIDGDQSTAENKVPVAGAEFTLYREDASGGKTIVYDGNRIKCTVIGTGITALSSDGKKATAVFSDILVPETDYYIAETKAPSGYRLLDTPLKIKIDASGSSARIDGISKDITGKTISIELANYLTLHIPSSGVSVTGGYFAAGGLLLLTASAIGLFLSKINRNTNKVNKKRKDTQT